MVKCNMHLQGQEVTAEAKPKKKKEELGCEFLVLWTPGNNNK